MLRDCRMLRIINVNINNDNNPSEIVIVSQIIIAKSQRPHLSCIRVVIPGTHPYSLASVSLTLPTATKNPAGKTKNGIFPRLHACFQSK